MGTNREDEDVSTGYMLMLASPLGGGMSSLCRRTPTRGPLPAQTREGESVLGAAN